MVLGIANHSAATLVYSCYDIGSRSPTYSLSVFRTKVNLRWPRRLSYTYEGAVRCQQHIHITSCLVDLFASLHLSLSMKSFQNSNLTCLSESETAAVYVELLHLNYLHVSYFKTEVLLTHYRSENK